MTTNRAGSYGPILATWVPVSGDSLYLAVTTSEQDFGSDMDADEFYVFTAFCDCFIKQGLTAQNASAGAGSMAVPRGQPVLLDASLGRKLSVIGETAGKATLQKVRAAL